jgi:Cu(I)/Ag(I) efflux system membrane fusion protein
METMTATDSTSRPSRWHSLAWSIKVAQVRLRFFVALGVAFLVVGRWDVLRTYWDRLTAPAARDPAMGAVSADTEYFCPMDPGVLSGWPGKCPICHMATVRRSKGDMGPLPDGVIARVQLSPDRVQLAGVHTETVGYRPLAREVRSVGIVEPRESSTRVRLEVRQEEARWISTGQAAGVIPDPSDGSAPASARVLALEPSTEGSTRLVVEVAEPSPGLRLSGFALVVIRLPMADREPFRSMPRGEPAPRPGEPRAVHVCLDHPDVILTEVGRCPRDDRPLERLDLAKNQRLAWWCPMHPKVVADRAGASCDECGGMALIARVVTYGPRGEVLAVPERAVIDTGTRAVVYLERMPGVFDGVEVRLGPRCGGFFPVVEGLEAGQSVASAGAFLIDAETRLNPGLAAGYFGAHRAEVAGSVPASARETTDLVGLAPVDRDQAVAQAICPVTGKRLGSMGTPVKVVVRGSKVFLCCEGCEGSIKDAPEKYLAKLKAVDKPAHHP